MGETHKAAQVCVYAFVCLCVEAWKISMQVRKTGAGQEGHANAVKSGQDHRKEGRTAELLRLETHV